MAAGKFVAYYRVSTEKQGRSGLGLEAQQEAVRSHLNGGNWRLAAEVVEIESGKRNHRPKLAEALRLCRLYGATLIIAKLDRLARNVALSPKLSWRPRPPARMNASSPAMAEKAARNPSPNDLTLTCAGTRPRARTRRSLSAAHWLNHREVSVRRNHDVSVAEFEEPKIPLFLVLGCLMCGLNIVAVIGMLMAAG
jgi:Resolvase, N terminal domain